MQFFGGGELGGSLVVNHPKALHRTALSFNRKSMGTKKLPRVGGSVAQVYRLKKPPEVRAAFDP
jgi:hypothetical protein